MNPLLIAFLGAAIAFLFFLVGQAILKAHDNAKEHRDALVRLERLLNEHLDVIHVHMAQIRTLRGTVENGRQAVSAPAAGARDAGQSVLYEQPAGRRAVAA